MTRTINIKKVIVTETFFQAVILDRDGDRVAATLTSKKLEKLEPLINYWLEKGYQLSNVEKVERDQVQFKDVA